VSDRVLRFPDRIWDEFRGTASATAERAGTPTSFASESTGGPAHKPGSGEHRLPIANSAIENVRIWRHE